MYGRQLGFKRKTILANKDSRSKVFNAATRSRLNLFMAWILVWKRAWSGDIRISSTHDYSEAVYAYVAK